MSSIKPFEVTCDGISVHECKDHEAWSRFLESAFGSKDALLFAAGSDIVFDHMEEDLSELAFMPQSSHIDQLSVSWLCLYLPEQFLLNYDYDFLYQMRYTPSKHEEAGKDI